MIVHSIFGISISAEMEVQPYHFEPKVSACESARCDDADHRDDFTV